MRGLLPRIVLLDLPPYSEGFLVASRLHQGLDALDVFSLLAAGTGSVGQPRGLGTV